MQEHAFTTLTTPADSVTRTAAIFLSFFFPPFISFFFAFLFLVVLLRLSKGCGPWCCVSGLILSEAEAGVECGKVLGMDGLGWSFQ